MTEPKISIYERLKLALASLPPQYVNDPKYLFKFGIALFNSDIPEARLLFEEWASTASDYDKKKNAKLWSSFTPDFDGEKVTVKTICFYARREGWDDPWFEAH